MNIPNESFFADLDVLNLNSSDPIQTEMAEETRERKPEEVDGFGTEAVEAEEIGPSDDGGGAGDGGKRVQFNYKTSAKWVVRILDGVNGKMLPPLYQRRMLSPVERQRISEFDSFEAQGLSYELEPGDEMLLEKRDRIRALVDAVPMTDDEKDELADALSDVMTEADMRISPMGKLLITLGMVEGVRLLPLLTSKTTRP